MFSYTISAEKFETVASVILRVPGYFILDYSYQNDLLNCIPKSMEWPDIVSSGFAIFGFLQGILVLLLPLEKLTLFYMHYLTIAMLAAADTFSYYYVEMERSLLESHPAYATASFQGYSNMLVLQKSLFHEDNIIETLFLKRQVSAIVFHILAAILVTFFLDLGASKEKILLLVYLAPVFARLVGCPIDDIHFAHNFASCFVIFIIVQYIFFCMPRVFRFMKGVNEKFWLRVHWYGVPDMFFEVWAKLFVPVQLLIFWMILFSTQVYSHLIPNQSEVKIKLSTDYTTSSRSPLESRFADFKSLLNSKDLSSMHSDFKDGHKSELISKLWHLLLIQSAAEVCYTPMMLVGACVTVAFASNLALKLIYKFTAGPYHTNVPDDITHSYWVGITMGVLALQSSLLNLSLINRVALLSIIFRIVLSSLIQNMFEVVEPIVLSISARGVASVGRHVRACIVLLILLLAPLYMVHALTLIFDQDIWLLIVASANLLTSIQTLGLIVIYLQLTAESLSSESWPALEDHIYYTRVATRICEFLVAVFLVGIGVTESVSGEWSVLNCILLTLHTYFNIYQRLQLGWKTFLTRRDAIKKIAALSRATPSQIAAYDDRCAICYSEMRHACVTNCKHLFHVECLQKCLYMKDNCPLCHTKINFNPILPTEQPVASDDYDFGFNIPLPDDTDEE